MSTSLRAPTWAVWAAVAVAAVPIIDALLVMTPAPAQVDDAYISYRYAAHLVEGHGLVWNVGERVEGFTNPLWTLLVAFGLALGGSAPALGYALGLMSGLALLLGTAALARSWLVPEQRWLAPLAPGLLACFGTFVFWSTAGMETSLHAALAMGALFAAAHGRRGWMVALLIALTWTRMDGALLAVVLLGFDAWPRPRTARSLRPGLVYVAGVVIGLLLRFAYYGSWLPNTYWAKVGGTPLEYGIAYVAEFLGSGAGFLLPLAMLAAWRRPETRPAAIFFLVHTFYVVRVGGDAFAFSRFFLVALAPLCALALAGLGEAWRARPPALAWALLPTLPVAGAWAVFDHFPLPLLFLGGPAWIAWGLWRMRPLEDVVAGRATLAAAVVGCLLFLGTSGGPAALATARTDAHRNTRLASEWRTAGYWEALMQRRAERLRTGEPPALVAAGAIGSLGFHSRLPVLDILGLTDPHIARAVVVDTERGVAMPGHARSDADYVMSRRPDVLFIPKEGDGPVWIFALQDLWAHPGLARHYVWDDELKAYRRRPSDPGDEASTGGVTGR